MNYDSVKSWISDGMPWNSFILGDCMEGMEAMKDKSADLAIVDPPYGIGADFNAYRNGIKCKSNGFKEHKFKKWDNEKVDHNYFNELNRISKDYILFGANYYPQFLIPSMCWIFWYKEQLNFSFSDGEFIATSFNKKARIFRYARGNESGFSPKNDAPNIHPTQKPIALYKWLLKNYAKPEFKIIDTHAGSCSSVIAFLEFGCQWIAFEIDKDYYEAASKRIENYKFQLKLF